MMPSTCRASGWYLASISAAQRAAAVSVERRASCSASKNHRIPFPNGAPLGCGAQRFHSWRWPSGHGHHSPAAPASASPKALMAVASAYMVGTGAIPLLWTTRSFLADDNADLHTRASALPDRWWHRIKSAAAWLYRPRLPH